jgi:hypothetical protein
MVFFCSDIKMVNADELDSEMQNSEEVKRVYPKKTQLDFEGTQIEGEVNNSSGFYFQHRPEEKFNSFVQRRKNFHREMMRDVVLSQ